jgi:hypothetical protein
MPADSSSTAPSEFHRIYRAEIRPLLFGTEEDTSEAEPTLMLLGGQPGSGKSRASARLAQEHDRIVALSGDDLRVFYPDYRALVHVDPERAGPVLAEATRAWARSAIQDAFENRRSLLLEGTFGDPDVTLDTAARFRQAGFHVRVVAIATPRVLSLVTVASRYLRDLQTGYSARFTPLSAHDRGYEGTTRLMESTKAIGAVDRVTILSRNGSVLHDGAGDSIQEWSNARAALAEGRHPEVWGARSTMELLGELKQITTYAINTERLTNGLAVLLKEAHVLARKDVVPHLSVNRDSPQARFIEHAVNEQLATLNRAFRRTSEAATIDVAQTERRLRRGPGIG